MKAIDFTERRVRKIAQDNSFNPDQHSLKLHQNFSQQATDYFGNESETSTSQTPHTTKRNVQTLNKLKERMPTLFPSGDQSVSQQAEDWMSRHSRMTGATPWQPKYTARSNEVE